MLKLKGSLLILVLVNANQQCSLCAALTGSFDDLIPPSERFIFNFNSKGELQKWHLYSDSEYGGMQNILLKLLPYMKATCMIRRPRF